MWVVLYVSDSDKHFSGAIKEYEKRLISRKLKVESVKPGRHGTHKQIVQKETELVISLLEKKYSNYFRVLLSKEGNAMTTEQFASLLKKNLDVAFVIGGPYGLDEEKILPYIDFKISFSGMTLQHGLAKLVLFEQLYRVSMIWGGKQYHY